MMLVGDLITNSKPYMISAICQSHHFVSCLCKSELGQERPKGQGLPHSQQLWSRVPAKVMITDLNPYLTSTASPPCFAFPHASLS
ncbi:Uncharacterized protein TCM_035030 [Theobroma cacao]|uniref:Uncharacterized protein n=1 Tax=Theobroma cacao TaxID=3641 RepID=A0A061FH33_THECC|nr:Uncharacterized protein TCM_035030 [Theobroma cacao]